MVLTCFCMLVESSQESAQFMWKQHFPPDPDLDTVVSVHEEDLPVSQSCYTMSSSLSSFIVASTMACLVPATLTVVGDCSLVLFNRPPLQHAQPLGCLGLQQLLGVCLPCHKVQDSSTRGLEIKFQGEKSIEAGGIRF